MPGERVVIIDDNLSITVTVYRGRDSFSAEVSPVRAMWLARELMTAALPKLAAGDMGARFGSDLREHHVNVKE